jgi:hypothetical protein
LSLPHDPLHPNRARPNQSRTKKGKKQKKKKKEKKANQVYLGQLPRRNQPANPVQAMDCLVHQSVLARPGRCSSLPKIWDAAESHVDPIHTRNGVQGFQGLPSGLARQRAERGARVRWRLFFMHFRAGFAESFHVLLAGFLQYFLGAYFGPYD